MINGLDLFSGIGGIADALSAWVIPIAYCESDPFCQAVLLSRMQEGKITFAPIYSDVRKLSNKNFDRRIKIDCISAGFPCQDISVAGTGKGLEGERSGLFFEIIRVASNIRPKFIFLENVPAITTRGGVRVITELTRIGYDCRWTIVSAAEVGAPHLRRRWFLLAYSNNRRTKYEIQTRRDESTNGSKNLANTKIKRLERFRQRLFRQSSWWKTEPDLGRVVNGLPFRSYRIKAMGNAVVPQAVEKAFMKLIGLGELKR